MPRSKRWPPLLIPQLPRTWIRSGMILSIIGALAVASHSAPAGCAFDGQACNEFLVRLEWLVIATLAFWILATGVFAVLGAFHILRVTISWLRLDVLRTN